LVGAEKMDKKVVVNKPIDWQNSWFLSESSKSVYFEKDEDGNIKAMPVVIIDPGINPVAVGLRSATIWKTVQGLTNAGGIWAPTAGTRWRLMGGIITISKESACASALWVALQDSSVNFAYFQISNAALVATGQLIIIPFTFPGNGYLSSGVNNGLNLNFSAALTSGSAAVAVWGTEE